MLHKNPAKTTAVGEKSIGINASPAAPTTHTLAEDVTWIEQFSQFEKSLKPVKKANGFHCKLDALKTIFTQCADNYHKLWLDYKAESILIAFTKTNKFHSNIFKEDTALTEHLSLDNNFILFSFYKDAQMLDSDIVMQLRVSQDGSFAELVYITKCNTLSGTNVLTLLHQFTDVLKIPSILLLDDAKSGEIPLRLLRPLTKKDRKSWYGAHGYEVYECEKLPYRSGKIFFSQMKRLYDESIELVRNSPISQAIQNQTRQSRMKALELLNRYFGKKAKVNKITITKLACRILKKSQNPSAKTKTKGHKDLLTFYNHFLTKTGSTKQISPYEQAIDVLDSYRLFMKKR